MTSESLKANQKRALENAREYVEQATDPKLIDDPEKSEGLQFLAAIWTQTAFIIEIARRLPPPLDDTE